MTPDEAVLVATTTRQLNWLRSLVVGYSCNVLDALVVAGCRGDVSTLEILLTKPKLELRGAAVAAAENCHLDAVRLLLKCINAQAKQVVTAWRVMESGARNGHVEMVVLAAEYADEGRHSTWSTMDDPDNALACAIAGGHVEVVRFLVGPCPHHWNFADALDQAAALGDQEVIELIHRAIPERIDEYVDEIDDVDDMMTYVAPGGRVHAARYLYEHGHNSAELMSGTFPRVVESGKTELMQFFLDTGKVSQMAFDKGFERAVQYGVPIYGAGCRGLETAVHNNIAEIARVLCDTEFISDEIAAQQLQNAARRGQVKVVEALIKASSISADVVKEVFANAVESK
ncbi:hypothetical protein PHYPSEUDO_007870 [Phytophthora pseudosyringae]|uniref:Ankyrin repeat protein n=1 Tax=Phytophthora pseudosyringae TaxID=221518 RepID=A0A8T1VFC5_9STRA|nr:hypothetical protein PHYPSEUDO_007870 [Phytophthora pseudosyringae]